MVILPDEGRKKISVMRPGRTKFVSGTDIALGVFQQTHILYFRLFSPKSQGMGKKGVSV